MPAKWLSKKRRNAWSTRSHVSSLRRFRPNLHSEIRRIGETDGLQKHTWDPLFRTEGRVLLSRPHKWRPVRPGRWSQPPVTEHSAHSLPVMVRIYGKPGRCVLFPHLKSVQCSLFSTSATLFRGKPKAGKFSARLSEILATAKEARGASKEPLRHKPGSDFRPGAPIGQAPKFTPRTTESRVIVDPTTRQLAGGAGDVRRMEGSRVGTDKWAILSLFRQI